MSGAAERKNRGMALLVATVLTSSLVAPWLWGTRTKPLARRPTPAEGRPPQQTGVRPVPRSILGATRPKPSDIAKLAPRSPARPAAIAPAVADKIDLSPGDLPDLAIPEPDSTPVVPDLAEPTLDLDPIPDAHYDETMTPSPFPIEAPSPSDTELDPTPEPTSPSETESTPPAPEAEPEARPEPTPEPTPPKDEPPVVATRWPWPASLADGSPGLNRTATGAAWNARLVGALQAAAEAPLDQVSDSLLALDRLASEARNNAAGSRGNARSDWNRAAYAVERRVALWRTAAIASIARRDWLRPTDVGISLGELRSRLAAVPGGQRWWMWIGGDALATAVATNDGARLNDRIAELHRRLIDTELNADQRKFLLGSSMSPFTRAVIERPLAERRLGELLTAVEAVEARDTAKAAAVLASYQGWLSQRDAIPEERMVAAVIESHWRNANVRVAISQRLVERMLPHPGPMTQDVVDEIRGATVTGVGTAQTRLAVAFLPDPASWQVVVCGLGQMRTETASTKGPVTIVNDGAGTFITRKLMVVDREGVRASPATADAQAEATLRDLETSLDGIPLVGSIARLVATNRYESEKELAQGEMNEKMKQRISRQFDEQVQGRLTQFESRFENEWLKVFREFGLKPKPMDLETTDQRLIARWRFAGDRQLASHTPRPQAPVDSYASFQSHQSLINNAIENLRLGGREQTLDQWRQELSARIGIATKPFEDAPEDVSIRFAVDEPARIDVVDGLLRLTLRIDKLAAGDDEWENFTVKAFYRAADDQSQSNLVREGTIQLAGGKMGLGDQIALRAIFSKVFSKNRGIDAINRFLANRPALRGLGVSQLSLDDGWIGLALGEHPQIARKGTETRSQ